MVPATTPPGGLPATELGGVLPEEAVIGVLPGSWGVVPGPPVTAGFTDVVPTTFPPGGLPGAEPATPTVETIWGLLGGWAVVRDPPVLVEATDLVPATLPPGGFRIGEAAGIPEAISGLPGVRIVVPELGVEAAWLGCREVVCVVTGGFSGVCALIAGLPPVDVEAEIPGTRLPDGFPDVEWAGVEETTCGRLTV